MTRAARSQRHRSHIPDDRRRTKIHKILSGFGTWTQYSLFECFLSKKELVQLKARLAKHLEDTQDSVRFYPLCANCVAKVETIGGHPHRMSSCSSSNLSREARRNDSSTLRASHGSRSAKSRIGPTFLTRNTVFLSRIPGSKKSPSQTLDSCRFLCYTTSTQSKWLGEPVRD